MANILEAQREAFARTHDGRKMSTAQESATLVKLHALTALYFGDGACASYANAAYWEALCPGLSCLWC